MVISDCAAAFRTSWRLLAAEAARRAGTEARLSRMTFGYWPQVKPAFWSIALFRWDINVRESAVLGLVGAGGIGMAMQAAIETVDVEI